MKDLNLAGVGGWHIHTGRFLSKIEAYPGCAVTAIWDPDRERGRKRAEQLACRLADSYEDVLADPDIDGVVITSPAKDHFEQILLAVQAGKHVFVEKPAFVSVSEAKEIRKRLEGTKVKFLFSDPIRTSIRQLMCAKELIDSERIGRITMIRTRCAMSMALGYEHVPAFEKERTGGGIMLDLGSHAVHMLYMLAGKPKYAHAAFSGTSISTREYGVEDNGIVVYEYENGMLGVVETSALASAREDFFLISGTEGSICCLDREVRFRTVGGEWITIDPQMWPEEPTYPLSHWIDCIQYDKPVEVGNIAQAIEFTEMITAAYAASEIKIPI